MGESFCDGAENEENKVRESRITLSLISYKHLFFPAGKQ
jgi:hypothetical protein